MYKLNKKVLMLLSVVFIYGCANYTPASQYSTQGAAPSKTENLVVPPGLDVPDSNNNYKMINQTKDKPQYVVNSIKDMIIQQGGSERWLVIKNKSVDQVWPMMSDFLNQQGLSVKYQNQNVGVIQTDWATRNNVVSQTGIRGFFEWAGWGEMYSMRTQYMFRITMWQNGSDTQLFVTDIQMSEIYPGCVPSANSSIETSDRQITRWMSLPPNPQLELEFLMQFMVFSGLNPEQVKHVKQIVAVESAVALKNATIVNNQVIINDSFDRSWWRTGLALDRVGLGVTDKNRTTGEYYVYSLQSQINVPETGFFSKLFGSGNGTNLKMPEAQYIVTLNVVGDKTSLTIKAVNDAPNQKTLDAITKYLNDLAKQLQ